MKRIFMLFLFFSLNSHAHFGVGAMVNHFNKVQTKLNGTRNKTDFTPYFHLSYPLPFFVDSLFFIPEAGYLSPKKGENDYKKYQSYILANFGYALNDNHIIKAGVGIFYTKLKGEGGTVVLNNGSSTSVFYKPHGSSKSKNLSLNLGYEFFFQTNTSLRTDAFVLGFASSKKRSFNYALSIDFYL
jgi:hypothetical protein